MDRLEIAARLLASITQGANEAALGAHEKTAIDACLGIADALIIRERETRPKCEHKNIRIGTSLTPNRCNDCGAEVSP